MVELVSGILCYELSGCKCEGVILMSDRDKEFDNAVIRNSPKAHQAHCGQHISDSAATQFGVAEAGFWKVARTRMRDAYPVALEELKEHFPAAINYL